MSSLRPFRLLGYDPAILEEMEGARPFVIIIWAALFGGVVFSISAAYLAFLSNTTFLYKAIGAGFIFVVVFAFILNLHRQFEINAGYPLHLPMKGIDEWKPGKLRIYCFGILALAFSQPILLALNEPALNKRIDSIKEERTLIFQNEQARLFSQKENALIQKQSMLVDKAEQISGKKLNTVRFQPSTDQDLTKEEQLFKQQRYKALVIGVQDYQDVRMRTLSNTVNDAKAVADVLRKMGYAVIYSENDGGVELQQKILSYQKLLQPGDYSVVYYAGHGFQDDGKNFITTKDYQIDGASKKGGYQSVDISSMMQEIGNKKPALNMLLLDACRSWVSNKTGGLAEMKGIQDTYFFVTATSPGQGAIDSVGGDHSPFTKALLSHLNDPENIDTIFNRVGADVKKSTDKKQVPQVVKSSSGNLVLRSSVTKLVKSDVDIKAFESLNSYCAGVADKFMTNTEPLVACLLSEIALLNQQIIQMQSDKDQYLQYKTQWYQDSLAESNMLEERVSIMWGPYNPKFPNHKFLNFLISLLIATLMMMSEILRLFWPEYIIALRKYERIKNETSRDYLKRVHFKIKDLVKQKLEKYPSYRDSKIPRLEEWDDEEGFYVRKPRPRINNSGEVKDQAQFNKLLKFLNSTNNKGSINE